MRDISIISKTNVPHKLKQIIIIDINRNNYNFLTLYEKWDIDYPWLICPACNAGIRYLRRHATYQKYYFDDRISILRLQCKWCSTTHAIIPSFSVPDRSVGTKEIEEYIINRKQQKGRKKAWEGNLKGKVSEKYLRFIDKGFDKAIERAKVILAAYGHSEKEGFEWINAIGGNSVRPIFTLNCLCLASNVNSLFFSRSSIQFFPLKSYERKLSLNPGTINPYINLINSS